MGADGFLEVPRELGGGHTARRSWMTCTIVRIMLRELLLFRDPQSATGQSLVLAMQGNNPDLKPETAKSWTTGFDVVPEFDPEFALSATYYSIDYTGQITVPDSADPSSILTRG